MTTAGGASGNPGTFAIAPASAVVCAPSGDATLSFTGVGRCDGLTDQAAVTTFYSAAPHRSQTITIAAASPGIDVTTSEGGAVADGGPGGHGDGDGDLHADRCRDLGARVGHHERRGRQPQSASSQPCRASKRKETPMDRFWCCFPPQFPCPSATVRQIPVDRQKRHRTTR